MNINNLLQCCIFISILQHVFLIQAPSVGEISGVPSVPGVVLANDVPIPKNNPWWCNAAKTFCAGGVDPCCWSNWDTKLDACIACSDSCGGCSFNGDTSGTINWQRYGWANGCDFKGRDFKNVRVSSDRCGPTCKATAECTHYVWTKFNGGTCWMKNGIVFRSQAFLTGDNSMVCGIDSLE